MASVSLASMRFSIALRRVSALLDIGASPCAKSALPGVPMERMRRVLDGKLCGAPNFTEGSKRPEARVARYAKRRAALDPFHMPAELADGLGVESLPRH